MTTTTAVAPAASGDPRRGAAAATRSSAGPVDDESRRSARRPWVRLELQRPQWPTMTSAGAACDVHARARLGKAVLRLIAHLHVQHRKGDRHVGSAYRHAALRVISTANELGDAAARFGATQSRSAYGFLWTIRETGPGPTRASAPPSCASAFAGGGRLASTAAAATAPASEQRLTTDDAPQQARRGRPQLDAAGGRRPGAASSAPG